MRLVLDSEQGQLRSTLRELLAEHAPPSRVREVMDGDEGYDSALWRRVSEDLGLSGLVVPESYGGSGVGNVERCIVLEELGRALSPVPYLASSVLAVDTVLAFDDAELAKEILPGLATGESIAAVALAGDDGSWGSSASSVAAVRGDGGWTLDGHASFVLSGDVADIVLVLAMTPEGPGFFVVSGKEVRRTPLHTLDPTRGMVRLDFAGAPARRAAVSDPAAVLDAVRDRAAVALAAERVGVIARVLEMTVEYAKTRVQFGRPIGSYQAVKHGCADMYRSYEQADSVLRYAAWAADHDPDELPLAAALTQVVTAPASFQAAADTVQLHGGIGYTWEHDAHLYYKRAKTNELLLDGPDQQQERLAMRLDI